ncbi:MAG: asparagine synthase (glutamine-hydrolyzing) [Bacteroidetes bacterium]|nr:asparagine synthase (glutamine-hydrolyzing) [Bacteroidota bacterium]
MCGIAGIISTNTSQVYAERLHKMTNAIAHRGPDGEGFWTNNTQSVGFGHRRLAIIDLSKNASQPMHFLDRYTIIHNGEIYNYIELGNELKKKGYQFRSRSDTEVILAAYDLYKAECLQYFDGMFAFAIWDEKEQNLFCARDRFGEKPFYYSFDEKQFLFASERKALWAAGVEKKINNPLLLNYLTLGLTQTAADNTITFHQDIFSLPAAHYISLQLPSFTFTLTRYWDADKETAIKINEKDAVEKLKELLTLSVQRRLRSDVATGTSLSGGLDSSSIVAFIKQLQSENQLQTFSAVFPGFEKDESKYIDLITQKFSIANHKVSPSVETLITDLEKLCFHQEEPFSSSSIYAQYKVFELAKQYDVKVLLDGQGADETLAGYSKYIPWFLQELLRKKYSSFRTELTAFKKSEIPFEWGLKNYLAALFPLQIPGYLEKRDIKKIKRNRDINNDFKQQFLDVQSIYKPLVVKLNDILYFNTNQFGLEELLRYADRNSMAHGREIRLPFLSHELVTFINSLPSRYKMHNGWTKWILRKTCNDMLPEEITRRKDKIGYEPPQKLWMENKTLQEYLHEAKKKLITQHILKPEVLNKKNQPLDAHAADNFDWRYIVAAAFV